MNLISDLVLSQRTAEKIELLSAMELEKGGQRWSLRFISAVHV
jgi:hypothetical protein